MMDDLSHSVPRKRSRKEMSVLRRANECAMIQEMAKCLPINPAQRIKASQSTLLRMALSYLRTRELLAGFQMRKAMFGLDPTKHFPGFVMIVDTKGHIMYAADAVTDLVGPNVVDVVGQSVEDLVHSEDWEQMSRALDLKYLGQRNMFVIRMKKTMASTVRSQDLVDYEPVFVTSHLKRFESSFSPEQGSSVAAVMLCKTQVHIGFPEIVMGAYVDLDMDHRKHQFFNIDPKAPWLLGFSEQDIRGHGKEIFQHPSSGNGVDKHHMIHTKLLRDGEMFVPHQRILSGWGQWLWTTTILKLTKAVNNEVLIVSGRVILLGPDDSELCLPPLQPKEKEQQVHTAGLDLDRDVDEILLDLLASADTPLALTHTATNTSTTSLPSSNSQSSSDTSSPLCPLCPNSSLADPSEPSSCFSVGSSTGLTCTPPPSLDQAPSPPVNNHSPLLVDSTECSGVVTEFSSSSCGSLPSCTLSDPAASPHYLFPDCLLSDDPSVSLFV